MEYTKSNHFFPHCFDRKLFTVDVSQDDCLKVKTSVNANPVNGLVIKVSKNIHKNMNFTLSWALFKSEIVLTWIWYVDYEAVTTVVIFLDVIYLLFCNDDHQRSIAYLHILRRLMPMFSSEKVKKSIFCMNNFFQKIIIFRIAYYTIEQLTSYQHYSRTLFT